MRQTTVRSFEDNGPQAGEPSRHNRQYHCRARLYAAPRRAVKARPTLFSQLLRLTALLLILLFFGGVALARPPRTAAKEQSAPRKPAASAQKSTAAKKPATAPATTAAKKPATAPAAAAKNQAAAKKAPSSAAKKTAAKKTTRRRTPTVRAPSAPSADRIREIQQALATSGQYKGAPTGRLDAATAAALSRFQQDNKLEVTGKLNAKTLKGLGKHGLPANTHEAVNSP